MRCPSWYNYCTSQKRENKSLNFSFCPSNCSGVHTAVPSHGWVSLIHYSRGEEIVKYYKNTNWIVWGERINNAHNSEAGCCCLNSLVDFYFHLQDAPWTAGNVSADHSKKQEQYFTVVDTTTRCSKAKMVKNYYYFFLMKCVLNALLWACCQYCCWFVFSLKLLNPLTGVVRHL